MHPNPSSQPYRHEANYRFNEPLPTSYILHWISQHQCRNIPLNWTQFHPTKSATQRVQLQIVQQTIASETQNSCIQYEAFQRLEYRFTPSMGARYWCGYTFNTVRTLISLGFFQ